MNPVAFSLFGINVHWYGIMYVLALLIALWAAKYFVKKDKLAISNSLLDNYFFWVEIGVILGARIGYIIIYDPNTIYYLTHPWQIFNPFVNGEFVGIRGMSYHGAVLGFIIATLLFCYKFKQNILLYLDLVAISVPLGYIFGRIGNFLNQELIGRATDVSWGKDVFYAVKEMLEKNLILNEEKAPVKRHKFTGKIFCSDCTWAYKMHVQNGITYWACSQNGTAGRRCVTHPMSEEIVERTFRNFYNKLKQHEGEILKSTYNRLIELKASITKSRSEVIAIDEELLALGERLTYLSRLLETRTLDKEVFNVRAADIKKKIADLRVKRRKLLADDEEEQCIEELRQTIAFMDEAPKAIIEYDHKLFNALIKRVLVEENRLVFELKCGITLREKIAWN